MHENATNSRMQHEWNALKCVQMYCNAQKCMRMRYVRNYTDLRKKLHHRRLRTALTCGVGPTVPRKDGVGTGGS